MFDDNGPLWLLVTLGFPVGIALVMVVRELRLLVRLLKATFLPSSSAGVHLIFLVFIRLMTRVASAPRPNPGSCIG